MIMKNNAHKEFGIGFGSILDVYSPQGYQKFCGENAQQAIGGYWRTVGGYLTNALRNHDKTSIK
jgi:hypothetical protein